MPCKVDVSTLDRNQNQCLNPHQNLPFLALSQAQCELWLHGLQPAASYLLSVQTVAYWGQKRLKSPKLQIIFTTITQRGKQGGLMLSERIKK